MKQLQIFGSGDCGGQFRPRAAEGLTFIRLQCKPVQRIVLYTFITSSILHKEFNNISRLKLKLFSRAPFRTKTCRQGCST